MKGFILFALLFSQVNWEVIKFPEKVDIHGLDVISENLWAVCGKDGMVGITRDGGKNWEVIHIPPHYLLTSVAIVSESTVWAVGERGWIVRVDKGGKWETVREPENYHLLDVFFLQPSDGWAVGDWGEILHWDGKTWIENPLSIPAIDRGVMEPIASEDIRDANGNILVRKGERIPDEILERIDKGEIKGKIRYDVILNAIRQINENLWIGGESGKLFIRTNDNWKEIDVGEEFASTPSIFSISSYDNKSIIGVGTGGYMIRVNMSGKVEVMNSFTDKDMLSIDVKGKTICIAGNDGLVGVSFDAGKNYTVLERKEYTYHWFRRARAISDGICLFAGMNGTIIKVRK